MNKGKIMRYVGIVFIILLCFIVDMFTIWFNINLIELLSSAVNRIFF